MEDELARQQIEQLAPWAIAAAGEPGPVEAKVGVMPADGPESAKYARERVRDGSGKTNKARSGAL